MAQRSELGEIEIQQNDIREEPGRRIGKADCAEGIAAHKAEGYKRTGDELRKTCKHGGAGKAHALQTVAEDEDDGQHRIGEAVDHQIFVDVGQNRRLGAVKEQPGDGGAAEIVHAQGKHAVEHGHHGDSPDAAADAV